MAYNVIKINRHVIKEEWKDIPGYEGLYQASTLGRIKSLGRVTWEEWYDGTHGRWHSFPEKILIPKVDRNDYLSVGLYNINKNRKDIECTDQQQLLF